MSDDIAGLKGDIAYMRALAEDGGGGPVLGGASLLAAGLIYAAASLVCWAMSAELIARTPFGYTGVWVGASALYYCVLFLLISHWRRVRKGAAMTAANRAFRWAWSAGGCAIGTIFLGGLVAASRLHTFLIFAIFPTIVLSIYGAAWTISAMMSRRMWFGLVAVGCFLAAISMAGATTAAQSYLGFAVALVLLQAAPGIGLMRQETPGAG